ncbi:MAG: ribosome silencing factor [Rubrivivax sp.]
MDIRKLQRAIVDGLEDVKGQNIAIFNTEALSPLFERVIIASGTSNRQTKALASSVRDSVRARGMQVLRTEGEANGEWIIVDCGAAVAHIMQPAVRDYYHLEEIWGGKNVRVKLGDTKVGLVKASAPEKAPASASAKAAAKKSASPSGKSTAAKPRRASPGATSKSAPPKRPAAKAARSTNGAAAAQRPRAKKPAASGRG